MERDLGSTKNQLISVYITCPDQQSAKSLADRLLERRLIACANLSPVDSVYRWQGKIENETEYLIIAKSALFCWNRIQQEVTTLHPYESPCIVSYQIQANEAYHKWVLEEIE